MNPCQSNLQVPKIGYHLTINPTGQLAQVTGTHDERAVYAFSRENITLTYAHVLQEPDTELIGNLLVQPPGKP